MDDQNSTHDLGRANKAVMLCRSERIIKSWVGTLILILGTAVGWGQDIVINEVMYHPSSENVLDEYIELHNAGLTDVDVGNWELKAGVCFLFPGGTTIPAGGYLVVAADVATFNGKYPGVTATVVGGWEGVLSNSGNRIELEDASGQRIDELTYADEGDWARRQRGLSDFGRRGWIWFKEHDGSGSSLELIHPTLPNEHGQSWASSIPNQGTPGLVNSVLDSNIAPLIVTPGHFPLIPTSSDSVRVSARIIDDQADLDWVRLHWRVDSSSPTAFTSEAMFDDGQNGDGAAGDGLWGVVLPAHGNNTVIEYYFKASDEQGNVRSWPSTVLNGGDQGGGTLGNILNPLYQVDNDLNNSFDGASPVYKIIQTQSQAQELSTTLSSARKSDAQYNATFISLDGSGILAHHLLGIRNRGHGSRALVPHNFRVNFRSDDLWKGVAAINLNSRSPHTQHLGAVLAQKAGADGANSTAVKLLFNNSATPVGGGAPTFGHYVANEAANGDWAKSHYPQNGDGELYKVVRDIRPPNFDYRGQDPDAYRNTYFKSSKESEDDWTSLINMLEVAGENASPYDPSSIREHADVDQWITHLAVMNIMANNESGMNTGNNDDYLIYTGDVDKRALFIYHDLDTVMGEGNSATARTTMDIFRATCCPISGDSEGMWRAMNLFLHHPGIEPLYYNKLAELIGTTFSAAQFDPLVDQVLGHYASAASRNNFKNWMGNRRSYLEGVISAHVTPSQSFATISGEPRSPTWMNSATLTVAGDDITEYQYSLNGSSFSASVPVITPIQLSNLPEGSTNRVSVRGRNSAGVWQSDNQLTESRTWIVQADTPTIRINEVLARNDSAVEHFGTYPDMIELYNESLTAVDVSGMRVTDSQGNPDKYVIPDGTIMASQSYLVLLANNDDGTSGLHTGFTLEQGGDEIYLLNSPASGGQLIDSIEFGHQLPDQTAGRMALSGKWLLSNPTLGASNVVQATGSIDMLRINEWLAQGDASSGADFVEIFNPTGEVVDMAGMFLTNKPIGNARMHTFRDATFVGPGGFLSFTADGSRKAGHVDIKLRSEQGQIALLDHCLGTVEHVVYGPQTRGVSLGYSPDGGSMLMALAMPTPGVSNVFAQSGGVVINEVLTDNASLEDGPGIFPDMVEFYNSSDSQVDLEGLSLSDSLADPRRWVFPAGSVVPARDFLTIRFDGDLPISSTNTGFGLSANGDAVYLFDLPANGGGLVDFIEFGLQLTDLSIGRFPNGAANWTLTTPTLGGANISAALGDPGQIRINEWMADPSSGDDWIELFNMGGVPVSVGGYFLTDDLTNFQKSPIPPLSFIGSAPRNWKKMVADEDVGFGANHLGFSLRASGEAIGFFAPEGTQIDALSFGLQGPGISEGRFPDGTANIFAFPETDSPGEANFRLLTDIIINEVLTHTDAPLEDAIELHNATGDPVDIGGWWLSDARGTPRKYQIPNGTTIPAGGYHVLYEYQFNDGGEADIPFSLNSAKGDEVHLISAPGGVPNGYRGKVNIGPSFNGVSFGPYQTSVGIDFTALAGRTFGIDQPDNLNQFRSGTGLTNAGPLVGPVVISEIMYHPPPLGPDDNVRDEFIELHNQSLSPVPLYDPAFPSHGWRLRSGVEFDFPAGSSIGAGGYVLVVSFDPVTDTNALAAFESRYGSDLILFGPYTGKLDNGGETLVLQRPDRPQTTPGPDFGLVPYVDLERVEFDDFAPWPLGGDGDGLSLERKEVSEYGNDPVNWMAAIPTPEPGSTGLSDTDNDGLPDAWENTHGTDPDVPDDQEDLDGDGMTNEEEFQAGTDPLDSNSRLQLDLQKYDKGEVTLVFDAVAGKTYAVQFRTSLISGVWTTLTDVPAQALDGRITVKDVQADPDKQRFYQLVTPSEP